MRKSHLKPNQTPRYKKSLFFFSFFRFVCRCACQKRKVANIKATSSLDRSQPQKNSTKLKTYRFNVAQPPILLANASKWSPPSVHENQSVAWRSHHCLRPPTKCQRANDWQNDRSLARGCVRLGPISCTTAASYKKWKRHQSAYATITTVSRWRSTPNTRFVSIWGNRWLEFRNIWHPKSSGQAFKMLWTWIWRKGKRFSLRTMDAKVLPKCWATILLKTKFAFVFQLMVMR